MKAILKTGDVALGDSSVTVTELSAVAYLDYMDYLGTLERPVGDISEDATDRERGVYLNAWRRHNMLCHSRIVALSVCGGVDIEEVHRQVQNSYNSADLQALHHAVALLSGFDMREPVEEEKPVESSPGEDEEPQEVTSKK